MGRPRTGERIVAWIDERYQTRGFFDFMRHKSVPWGRETIWYYFGGLSLYLFAVQAVTGILLLFYYRAGEDTSYESVQFLVSRVQFGWLVRSIHSWGANLMVGAAFIHMFSVFFTKSYRKPRELSWVSGMVMFVLAMAFGFSGYLLPWNELAFFATRVGTDIVGVVPVIGHPLMVLLRGGEDVTGATLSRFFGFHVALLPAIFTMVVVFHVGAVQLQGMSEPIAWEGRSSSKRPQMPFFPNFLLRDLLVWLIVLQVLAMLAVFFPWDLGRKADPFAPAPAGIRPEWYFVWMFQSFKFLPAHVLFVEGELLGVVVIGAAGLMWILLPFWNRSPGKGRIARVLEWVGGAAVLYILVLTVLGYVLK